MVPWALPEENRPLTLNVPVNGPNFAFAVPVNEPLLLTFMGDHFTKYWKM